MFNEKRIDRERIDDLIDAMAQTGFVHLIPLLEATRDLGIAFNQVRQVCKRFDVPRMSNRPLVAIICDDTDKAVGPGGFHQKSVRDLIRTAHAAIIVTAAPELAIYATAAITAGVSRRNVVIIETRPEQEIPWIDFVQMAMPNLPLLISSVASGKA